MNQIIEEIKAKVAALEAEVVNVAEAEVAKVKTEVEALITRLENILHGL